MVMAPRSHENGVSEVIGSILLIAVVVAAVSIIGIFLLSQPLPQEIPSLNAIIWNDTSYVYVKHDGGDSLNYGAIKLYVNGTDETSHFNLSTSLNQPWTTWSIGNTLQYPTGSTPVTSVEVVWVGGGTSSVVLTSVFY
jgi:flagellin-like protein